MAKDNFSVVMGKLRYERAADILEYMHKEAENDKKTLKDGLGKIDKNIQETKRAIGKESKALRDKMKG